MTAPKLENNPEHLNWLDGLRGLAAMWVFLSHAQILSGAPTVALLSWGGLAVDLFMMLSGFLMAHHYLLRERVEHWGSAATWLKFWTRRFFRIAPLYYLLLAAALLLSPWLKDGRDAIASVWPATATETSRYLDGSLSNVLAHLTFVFGALPQFAFRTPLPDWSIGLEMQFYLVFPFLMLLMRRFGAIFAGFILIGFCVLINSKFRGYVGGFEMPAFLPMKMYVFVIGMWIAFGRSKISLRLNLVGAVLVTGVIAWRQNNVEAIGRVVMTIGLYYLMNDRTLPSVPLLDAAIEKVRLAFSGRSSRFLGDTSYGFYLLHLLVLTPLAGSLSTIPSYQASGSWFRFLICVIVAGPISLVLTWLLHRTVEQSGIDLGKRLLKTFSSIRTRRQAT